jgi:DNA-binding NarL/FixJ family response regulator
MDPGGAASRGAGWARAHISVVVVDDHEMVAEALFHALADEPDIEVVGRAGTAPAALAVARQERPDVVVVDTSLPGGSGADLMTGLLQQVPGTSVVALGALDDPKERASALEAGASAFVWKGQRVDALLHAIRAAPSGVHERPAPTPAGPGGELGSDLTAREREVLGLLAEGLSTDEIVQRLVLSPHTVRNHIRSVLAKLRAHSRLEAVAIAARAGVIRLAPHPPERA